MRHRQRSRRLSRWYGARMGLFNSLINALFHKEAIQTTITRAKETRRIAEKLITKAKMNTLASRRAASAMVREPRLLQKLFNVLGPRYANRAGGYTRIIRIGPRKGDAAPMVLLELVDRPIKKKKKKEDKAKGKKGQEVPIEGVVAEEASAKK